jgi:(p)ppGpp synthase/HD superfamily hydrolase
VLTAGLLHDLLEQTSVTPAEIAAQFGPRVLALVEAVTLPPDMTTEESVRRAEAAGDDALLIRLCDRVDGLRRSAGRPPEEARLFRAEARRIYLPIARARFPQIARALEEALAASEAT